MEAQVSDNPWLYCETLDGVWFYMNIYTGEQLEPYVTPIWRVIMEQMHRRLEGT